ncbi:MULTISPECIES: hypothetical protein [Clostridium]|uniref:hypothetical protein n=1 Tax=Clostridium TaxID=1485 RepID=UPI00082659E4|nr:MULTISPECIES: hypothetical protein [Clostridium]PJI09321.1 hypothetical protein CUB90_16190 [Clostridium sp. CT7]
MDKYKFIEDDYLEKIGAIKEIDTLNIIKDAKDVQNRKKLRVQDFIYCFFAMTVIILEFFIASRFGIFICLFINFILSSILPFLLLIKLKNNVKGDVL